MELDKIKNICNLGTGTMGFGTALLFAMHGYNVRMFGRSDASIERGMKNIKAALELYKENKLINYAEIEKVLSRIVGCTNLKDAAKDADFIIESVAENLLVKQEVWKELENYVGKDVIFATNTSGLSPTEISSALVHKDRFVVTHFWNPPHLVPLVEVVPGKWTSSKTMEVAWALIKKIGKKPVSLKKEAAGFIGNRLQLALLREALYIVESGIATQEAVDTAVKYGIGRRLSTTGPIETADLGGLDIFYNIAEYLNPDLCDSKEPSRLLTKAMETGELGAKTGTGLYHWTTEHMNKIKNTREKILLEWLQKDKTEEF